MKSRELGTRIRWGTDEHEDRTRCSVFIRLAEHCWLVWTTAVEPGDLYLDYQAPWVSFWAESNSAYDSIHYGQALAPGSAATLPGLEDALDEWLTARGNLEPLSSLLRAQDLLQIAGKFDRELLSPHREILAGRVKPQRFFWRRTRKATRKWEAIFEEWSRTTFIDAMPGVTV